MFNVRNDTRLYLPTVEASHQPGPYQTLIADAKSRNAEYSKIWDLFAFRNDFTVHLAPEWAERDPALKQRCLDILSSSLARLARVVPAPAWQKLKQVPIWLEYEDVQFINGVYHPSRFWLLGHGMAPDRAKSIQFTRNLATLNALQPNLVLHELAHAYHDLVLTESDPDVIAAYQKALASGLYDSVERKGGGRERAYALKNHREFFAELSETYFGQNDYFPFTREQLRDFDPESFKVIAEAWDHP